MKPRWQPPAPMGWQKVVDRALEEDLGHVDLAGSLFEPGQRVAWAIEAQAEGVLCGSEIAATLLGADAEGGFEDGSGVSPGDIVLSGEGGASDVLRLERTALNFLMHLSGISTLAWSYVCAVEGTGAKIVDTRKTAPGLRALQKYAVRCGGAHNHRLGLFDGLMVKDNHIQACGGIAKALELARANAPHMTKVEVECATLAEVAEAVEAGAEVVMLDNMDPGTMAEAVRLHKGKALFEASGGITLENVRQVAETGVDLISVGAITHSAPALAFHLILR